MSTNPNLNPKPRFYAVLLQSFTITAKEYGYALALHGSLANDMDIIVTPWVEDFKPIDELINAFRDIIGETVWRYDDELKQPTIMPCGRMCYTLPISGDWYIDISYISNTPKILVNSVEDYAQTEADKLFPIIECGESWKDQLNDGYDDGYNASGNPSYKRGFIDGYNLAKYEER